MNSSLWKEDRTDDSFKDWTSDVRLISKRSGGIGRVFVLLGVMGLWFLYIGGCSRPTETVDASGRAAYLQRVAGVPLEMIDKADLRVGWFISRMPLSRGRMIERIFYHHGQLYVLDSGNKLYAYDGAKGILQWAKPLAHRKAHCCPIAFYEDRLLVVMDSTYMEVREKDGAILHQVELKITPTTSVARHEDWIYVGAEDQRFYCLRRKDGIPVWQSVQPQNPVGLTAVSQGHVYFTCRDGALYVSAVDQRAMAWHAETAGMVPGVSINEGQCFLPSSDTALYCFRARTGELMWKYLSGGPLTALPVLTNRYIYQSIEQSALLCLDRRPSTEKGAVLWELKDGSDFLAENGPVTYAMTLHKELTLMNNLTAQRMLSIYMPKMDMYPSNNEDTTIFLANRQGALLSLQPKFVHPAPKKAAPPETPPAEKTISSPE